MALAPDHQQRSRLGGLQERRHGRSAPDLDTAFDVDAVEGVDRLQPPLLDQSAVVLAEMADHRIHVRRHDHHLHVQVLEAGCRGSPGDGQVCIRRTVVPQHDLVRGWDHASTIATRLPGRQGTQPLMVGALVPTCSRGPPRRLHSARLGGHPAACSMGHGRTESRDQCLWSARLACQTVTRGDEET